MQAERHVRLFRNGCNRGLRILRELELDADEATVRKDGDRLIVEPVRRRPDSHWTTPDFTQHGERRGPSLL